MNFPHGFQKRLANFVRPLYAGKDTMHDLSHIDRIRRVAFRLSQRLECDRDLLEAVVCLHGVIWSHEVEIREFLLRDGLSVSEADVLVSAAWGSQKDRSAQSAEGRLLHDAHLLEGDENFLITKTLVTGSARGQPLSETISYFEDHLLGQYRCYDAENQAEYERRERIAFDFIAKLKAAL